jgi:hypothetical protein
MTSASSLLRNLLVYTICLPLAVFLGYTIAQEGNPLFNPATYFIIGLVLFVLALPLVLRWHHALLILTWNLGAMLFFVPGRPDLWWAIAWLSFSASVIQFILTRKRPFLPAPGVTRSLVFLSVVVLGTAAMRGGIGLAAFGSEIQGGKRYLVMLTAVAGYFAVTSQSIRPDHAARYVIFFFLAGLTGIISELGPILPPGLYYIFLLFPISTYGIRAIANDPGAQLSAVARLGSLSFAAFSAYCAMMARYGISQIVDCRHFLRLTTFLVCMVVGLLGGFRSILVQMIFIAALVFWLEGLVRSRLFPIMILVTALCGAVIISFADRLPLNVQRSLSILPGIQVDPIAKRDAESSSDWRLQIWKDLLPQVPKYLIVGKGLGFTASDLQSYSNINPNTGLGENSLDGTVLVSDYHNGPFSVILPFGIMGAIGFLWFLIASLRVLRQNYHFGNPAIRRLNTFLYGFFISKTIFFFAVFGNLYSDLALFTGIVGLSISINNGVAKRMILIARPMPHPRALNLPHGARKPVPAPV